ncbi:hypothetical protein KSC_040010 [Ktedonobacter sp. SOSP1-52]|uniref:hypothetical protein n=1 Tax=Ktedonobacter sp. SOSP1-52 TaxID=2778366 RepID=UPI001915CFBF|nr:hypothetical protein [Ktedonobacter sp. SOSP1-52]GHO65109.1 hypothetical protein KSC_040010 [Ktedonobacter sp. SOSP1-52]
MSTQSVDTHPDAERVLIDLIRKAPVERRFRLVQSLTQSTLWANIRSWQERYAGNTEREAAVRFVSFLYGEALAQHVQAALERQKHWHVQPIDLATVAHSVLRACERIEAPCYLGGSIASSLHGMQQMAQDIDLLAELDEQNLFAFLAPLERDFLFEKSTIREAVRRRVPFSLLHLDSLAKVDIIVPRCTAFDASLSQLVTRYVLDERYPPFPVASASEMILFKLRRFRLVSLVRTDGMRDDAEWNDIVSMIKVQGSNLDVELLAEWARTLDVAETWRQALKDAGRHETSSV